MYCRRISAMGPVLVMQICCHISGEEEMCIRDRTEGVEYEIAQDCQILPYLTRNMVTLSDLNEGKKCLIWSDDDNVASKIVLFASEEQPIQQEG